MIGTPVAILFEDAECVLSLSEVLFLISTHPRQDDRSIQLLLRHLALALTSRGQAE
jgi:hypothetical protein